MIRKNESLGLSQYFANANQENSRILYAIYATCFFLPFYQNTEVSDRIGEIVSTFESGEKARPTKERI